MKFLNLGCGTRYLDNWVNVDFVKTGPGVIACNLLKKIPFANNQFDVVYHSHVLEHFSKDEGAQFIKECYRILKPGSILRIVVPDLEMIAREYLKNLDRALLEDESGVTDYDWIILEMYDQVVRSKPGGSMGDYWRQPIIKNEKYVASRLGNEFTAAREHIKKNNAYYPSQQVHKVTWKEKLIAWIAGDEKAPAYLKLGKFRSGGEIHQWMYDRFSLAKLLHNTGFKQIKKLDAFTSSIPEWNINQWLDVEDGKTRKPDSLFMEAQK